MAGYEEREAGEANKASTVSEVKEVEESLNIRQVYFPKST